MRSLSRKTQSAFPQRAAHPQLDLGERRTACQRQATHPRSAPRHLLYLDLLWLALLIAAILASLIAFASPYSVRADGGAPNLVYVALAGAQSDEIAVIDIGKHQVTGHISLSAAPAGVVLSADGRFAYATLPTANALAILDTHTQQVAATIPAGTGPHALAIDLTQTNPILYVTDSSGNTLTILDPTARRTLATIPIGQHPLGLAIAGANSGVTDPSDPEVYVANGASDTVTVIGAVSHHILATVPAPGGPLGVVVPGNGGVAYVTTRTGAILALGLADHRLLGTVLQTPGDVFGTMDYDAVTDQVFVPDATTNSVDVLAPVTAGSSNAATGAPPSPPSFPHEPARVLRYDGAPAAVAITFEGSYGFVAERSSGRVIMVDVATHHTLATINVGGPPLALVTGPYPPLLSSQSTFLVDMLVIVLIAALMGSLILTERLRSSKKKRGAQQKQVEQSNNQGDHA